MKKMRPVGRIFCLDPIDQDLIIKTYLRLTGKSLFADRQLAILRKYRLIVYVFSEIQVDAYHPYSIRSASYQSGPTKRDYAHKMRSRFLITQSISSSPYVQCAHPHLVRVQLGYSRSLLPTADVSQGLLRHHRLDRTSSKQRPYHRVFWRYSLR